jgi:Domain of unknown function (DUF4383)
MDSGTRNIAQLFAVVVGVAYLAIGLIGFAVTGFSGAVLDGPDALLGFDLNPFHNVVHLGVGLILLVTGSLRDPVIAEGALIGGGLVYLLAAVLGFLGGLEIISINDGDELAPDNFLHLFSGAAALAAGVLGARQSSARMVRA